MLWVDSVLSNLYQPMNTPQRMIAQSAVDIGTVKPIPCMMSAAIVPDMPTTATVIQYAQVE